MTGRDTAYDDREKARTRYKPATIRWLLVAEAPPFSLDRFFYYDNVRTRDRLFMETIHAIYRHENPEISIPIGDDPYDSLPNTEFLRRRKAEFLRRFMNDGFYLIDSVDEPMPADAEPSERRRRIDGGIPCLVEKLRDLKAEKSDIILISNRVYRIRKKLREEGFAAKNTCMIDFPLGRGRKPFLRKMTAVLEPYFDQKRGKSLSPVGNSD